MDFGEYTSRPSGGQSGDARDLFSTGTGRPESSWGRWWHSLWRSSGEAGGESADYVISPGSRKAVLTSLAIETWKKDRYDPREEIKEVRGREVKDEAQLLR